MKIFHLITICCLSFFASCSDDGEILIGPGPNGDSLLITEAFPLLDFNAPVDLQNNGDNYLYVVEQQGTIKVFVNDPGTDNSSFFLDLTASVDDSGNEEGLLGLAFHPDFSQNGYFYLNYTTSQSTTRVSRFQVSSQNNLQADPSSEVILLEFSQPFSNHNGGQLAFGPDGHLYIAVGDGGSGGDPNGNGQNTATLLGNILRIDVNNPSGGQHYGIPVDNPFVNSQSGDRPEIFAYGLRNPWRMSFDPVTSQLWVADVGQNEYEEIDIVENGGNYGWKITEAEQCYNSSNCDRTGLIDPYFQYNHGGGNGSVTGGFVYRGAVSSLHGWYIYADYSSGRIWALETASSNPSNELLFDTSERITSFGVDRDQELYIIGRSGKIFKIVND